MHEQVSLLIAKILTSSAQVNASLGGVSIQAAAAGTGSGADAAAVVTEGEGAAAAGEVPKGQRLQVAAQ